MKNTADQLPPDPPAPSPHWVPVRPLGGSDRDSICSHLLALDARDRYLRFGHAAADEHIRRYVDRLDFERDAVFGAFDSHLRLIAWGHLSPLPSSAPDRAAAELGLSVSPQWRRGGFGARLFRHAMLVSRNLGIRWLMIHALTENAAMLAIARHAGAKISTDGPDAQAWLALPDADWGSRFEQWAESHAARLDYSVKQRSQRRRAAQ